MTVIGIEHSRSPEEVARKLGPRTCKVAKVRSAQRVNEGKGPGAWVQVSRSSPAAEDTCVWGSYRPEILSVEPLSVESSVLRHAKNICPPGSSFLVG